MREYFSVFRVGDGDFITNDVARLTGNPARSYETFARDFAAVFGGQAEPAAAAPLR